MKKTLVTLGALALAAAAHAQADNENSHKVTKVWETEATLKTPESVRLDAKRKVLYVSNIDGEPWAADGKGSIAKVGLDGKVIAAEWVTGLDCPKGLALSDDGKWLYAADMGGIVVIDVEAGKIKNKIAIPDGQQLNDLVNDKGTLYVSDSKGKKVYEVRKDKASVYLDEKVLKGPNGLFVHGGALYVLDNDSLNRVEKDKSLKVLASRHARRCRRPREREGRRFHGFGLERCRVVRAGQRRQGADVRRQGREDQHGRHRLGSGHEYALRADLLQEHRHRLQGRVVRPAVGRRPAPHPACQPRVPL